MPVKGVPAAQGEPESFLAISRVRFYCCKLLLTAKPLAAQFFAIVRPILSSTC